MTQQSQNTKLDNSTYNVMAALGSEADFLHSTVDRFIEDAKTENKNELLEIGIRLSKTNKNIWTYSRAA